MPQPVRSDPFAVLGLEPGLDISPDSLKSAYLSRMREAHPDFASSDLDAQLRSTRLSAEINAAFKALESPASRAEALLGRLVPGVKVSDAVSPGFLEEMLDLQGQAAEAPDQARTQVARLTAERLSALAPLAAQLGQPAARESYLRLVAELKYLERIAPRLR